MATRFFGWLSLCATHVRTARCSYPAPLGERAPRAAMALVALSGDEQRILFTQLCNVLEPRTAVALSSANS